MDQPNPLAVLMNIARVLLATSRPEPSGTGTFDHDGLSPVLTALSAGGLPGVVGWEVEIDGYLEDLSSVAPDSLSRAEALAFWINLYNAGAVRLAIDAFHLGETSVLRIPGGFSRELVTVAGESLSLDSIEHAKLRRLGDPRIHGALVCGSLSCPTLRAGPYVGDLVDAQLDDQMRTFLATGGAVENDGTVLLSRVFLWYGSDFARPHRMPTFIPVRRSKTLEALRPWLPAKIDRSLSVEFQPYDWGLSCSIG